MKKLIKDLTDNEIYKICTKQKHCSDCPLYLGEDSDYADVCLRYDHEKFERALEIANREIEVE